MKENKRKTLALIYTIAFHALAVVVLLLLGLSYPEPPPPEIGVEMDYGSLTDAGNAMAGDLGGSDAENATALPQNDDHNYVTQNTEPSPVTARPENTATQPSTPVTEPVQTIDPNALFQKGKVKTGGGSGQGTGQGSGTGAGNNGGGGSGTDLTGSGTSFSLAGRNAKALPKPSSLTDEVGDVVVTIIVDRNGNVLRAEAGAKGTTISNSTILKQCENAARTSKFSSKADVVDAVEEQRGTITYKFVR